MRKDKGITKPKAATDEIITPAEFKKLSRAEKERRLTNIVNTLNRRYQRLIKHGAEKTEAARDIRKRAEKAGATESGRISKAFKKKSEKELEKIYKTLAPARKSEKSKITTIRKKAEDVGKVNKKEFNDLTREEKRKFYEAFERLKETIKPEVERNANYYKWLQEEFYNRAVNYKQYKRAINSFINNDFSDKFKEFITKQEKQKQEFDEMLNIPGYEININDLL